MTEIILQQIFLHPKKNLSSVKQEVDIRQNRNSYTIQSPYLYYVPNIRKLTCVVPEKNVTEIFCDADAGRQIVIPICRLCETQATQYVRIYLTNKQRKTRQTQIVRKVNKKDIGSTWESPLRLHPVEIGRVGLLEGEWCILRITVLKFKNSEYCCWRNN